MKNYLLVFSLHTCCGYALAQTPGNTEATQAPGHSTHAQTFNEGPRQSGYLMQGMGNTRFPISTKNAMAQRFFDQGIAQLHGFWYFEAERSFRQAASFDPEHPMHYWGMARANIDNRERSLGFIEQAMSRLKSANDKEKRLIEAWNKRVLPLDADKGKTKDPAESRAARRAREREDGQRKKQEQDRLKDYAKALEDLAQDFPEDLEIKAMLVLQLWQNDGAGIPIQSHASINALLSDIFRANPRHPAHHFRIHLWDYRKEKLALHAAANCGPAAPGIAHMWHMPGHTYSRLKRYSDAAWQQEASARVDHAHMIRDRVMPDQIHNYAHNNEWLIRNLMNVGRARQAIDVAKNMTELPRHPDYNMLGESGSANYGRERLIQVLSSFGKWDLLLSLTNSGILPETGIPLLDDERIAWQAMAAVHLDMAELANEKTTQLRKTQSDLRASSKQEMKIIQEFEEKDAEFIKNAPKRPPKLLATPDWKNDPFGEENDPTLTKPLSKEYREPKDNKWPQPRKDAEKKLHGMEYRLQRLGYWLKAIEAYQAAAKKDFDAALRASHEARPVFNSLVRMEWLANSGRAKDALSKLEKRVKDGPGELLPLATAAYVGSQMEDKKEMVKSWLLELAPIAFSADKDLKVLERLQPIIEGFGLQNQWNSKPATPDDLGDRPSLDSLGPLRWTPPSSPIWYAIDSEGNPIAGKQFSGKPYIAILYLGFGCLHCAEQLGAFSPKVEEFTKLGVDVIGISTENPTQLREGMRTYDKPMKLRLFSNADHDVFRSFRAFDDFEGQPLHGTYLIDAAGKIRWQDIGHEPFMKVDFLLKETERLLAIPQ